MPRAPLIWDDARDLEALRAERGRLVRALQRCPPFARRRIALELRLAAVTARLIAAELDASRDRILQR